MKKIVAKILACALFLTTFQGMTIFAAETPTYGFQLSNQTLIEQNSGLGLSPRDDKTQETILARWDLTGIQHHKLVYSVEAMGGSGNVTKRVELDFKSSNTKAITFSASTYKGDSSIGDITAADINTYTSRILKNDTKAWDTGNTTTGSVFNMPMEIGDLIEREKKEINFLINNISVPLDNGKVESLAIRAKIVGDEILVYTNGISKGNITDFKLFVGNPTIDMSKPGGVKQVFNGPKNYTITPTHLEIDGVTGILKSKVLLMNPQTEKPGSKPGIKVSFNKLKAVDTGGNFTYIEDATTLNKKVTLLLGPEYTLDSMSEGIRLDFLPMKGEDVQVGLATNGGEVKEEGNQLAVYISEQDLTAQGVLQWDILQTSMIADGSFEYGNTGIKYWPSNKGHTYLGYSFNKTTSNQVQLNVQPYNIKAKATYSVYTASTYDEADGSGFSDQPQMIYEYDPNKTNNKSITAVVSANTQSYFKIEVKIDDNIFSSQIVYYNPVEFPAIPEITRIKDIDNIYVVPNEEGEQPKAIGFDIEWAAPDNLTALLQTGDLYYELLLRKNKDDKDPLLKPNGATEDEYATYSKIFKVSLNGEGKPIVEPALGTAGGDYKSKQELRYRVNTKSFTMENVVLKNFVGSDNWEAIEMGDENHLNVLAKDYLKGAKRGDDLKNRSVPGTYYLSFRTVFKAADGDKSIVYSAESNMEPISLDITKEIIPVPGSIEGEDTTPKDKSVISEKILYGYVDIQNYVKKMLEPAYKYLYTDAATASGRFSGEYEVYLYQKQDKLSETISKVQLGTIPVREITTGSALDLRDTTKLINGKTDIDRLREGEVVPIVVRANDLRGIGAGDFEIVGLDPNQVYYIRMRTKLTPKQYDGGGNLDNSVTLQPEYSLFSKDFTFTTTTKPIPPNVDDKVPPAPEDIWIVEQPNNTTATLGWAPADFEQDEDITKTYYEFMRTDKQLVKPDMSKDVEVLVTEDGNRVGFRSDSPTESDPFMSTYLQKNGTWARLSPDQASTSFKLTDDTLAPNSVYYYYVRTVAVIDGKAVKSTWIMVPVTTSPVASPINLKVEAVKDYNHDPKEEVVVSFDAPIPNGANVPNDYEFEIAVQGETDSEYSSTRYSVQMLTSKQDDSLTPDGYTHFVYRIYNLKPNRRYDIKVRIKDKTKSVETGGQYPTSLYSDKVTTRTEYDELEQEKDDKYKEYLKKFDDAVEKLRRKPYWTVKEGNIYKYRASYINTELGLQNEYKLVGESGVTDFYYYLPASMFDIASDMNTVLQVTLGGQTINIRPNTLTAENEDIAEAIKFIKSNKYEDYYIGLRFYLYDRTTSVQLQNPISPEIFLDMEVVYMKQEDMLVEDDIMIELNTLIDRERLNVIRQLEKELLDNVIEEDVLLDIIEEAVADIEGDHPARVKKVLDRHESNTSSIYELEKGILVMTKADSFAANGYYFNGSSWVPVDTYALGDGFALEATRLGTYVFTGEKSLVDTVPELAAYQSTISKYNLSDFFTINNYMINTGATKEQVYGAAARVLGGKRGTDYAIYLKSKGIKGITNIGMSKTIRQDEAIYVMMQVYEKKRSKTITSIMIKNKQSVQNIGAFQVPYRDYIYAAVELKVVDNPSNKVLPSKEMSVKEIITMLHKIDTK